MKNDWKRIFSFEDARRAPQVGARSE